jgi:hypothetical protein
MEADLHANGLGNQGRGIEGCAAVPRPPRDLLPYLPA